MKILFLTPWYPDELSPNHGVFIRDQLVALSASHEVAVVSSKVDYGQFAFCSYNTREDQFGTVKEFRIRVKRSLPLYNQINFFLLTVGYTLKIARAFKPDIIHGNIGYPGGLWSWLVSRFVGKPYVITEHTRLIHNFRSGFHRWSTRFAIRRASVMIAVSRKLADEIQQETGKEVIVIPNIVKTDQFSGLAIHRPEGPIQIGFLGGMNTPIKGVDILLKAMAGISKPFFLHIGGAGALQEQYEMLARELGLANRCKFYGFVPHWSVANFMERIDFLVSASRYESFGITLLEAIAAGIPVLATRCGGPEDFVNDTCGKLAEVESPESLKSGALWMMDHFEEFDKGAMKKHAASLYSPERVVVQLNSAYKMAF